MRLTDHNASNPALDLFLIQLAGRYSISKTYDSGQTLYSEGERGESMLLILTGSVKILKESSADGDLVQIGARGAGEFLGEMALVEALPRSATVVAQTACEVLEFSKDSFEKIIQEQPALATRVLRSLSNKLRQSDSERIIELEESNKLLNASNEELVRLNAFLDCVIDRSPSAILLATRSGQIFRMNAAAGKMFDVSEKRFNIVVDDMFSNFSLMEFRLKPDYSWHGEVGGIRDGVEFPAYLSVASLTGHNESMLHLLICQDISELQAFNRAIVEFEKYATAQDTAVELAHDLKNLLGVLLGNIDLVIHGLSDTQKEESKRAIDAIRAVSGDANQFTEDIMSFRNDKSEILAVDLRTLVKAIIRFCQLQGIFHEISLEYSVEPDFPPSVDIKQGQIQSVIVNLLTNAAEALTEGAHTSYKGVRILLSRSEDGESAVIQILDNGPGISQENIARMFKERFTTKPQGHGIGLISVVRIVKNHGGKIEVESNLGAGTTFTITLPIKRKSENA